MKPTLMQLAMKYHSDKLYWHSYISSGKYEELFGGLKQPVNSVLELGIGNRDLMLPFLPEGTEYVHGSSLRLWKDFFPDAQIYGCDNREDTLFSEYRIQTMLCDQSQPFDLGCLVGSFGPYFDIIIDDASHQYEDQRLTVSLLRHSAMQLYVIEDVFPDKGNLLAEEFHGEFWQGEKGRDDGLVIIRK